MHSRYVAMAGRVLLTLSTLVGSALTPADFASRVPTTSAPLPDLGVPTALAQAGGRTWTQLSPPAPLPGPRSANNGAVLDTANNRMMMFGGFIGGTAQYNDAWVLTNANGLGGPPQWINLIPQAAPGSPHIRCCHSTTYDPATNQMTIFGGFEGGCTPTANDVWVLSHANGLGGTATWSQLSPTGTAPGVRGDHSGVYDPLSNRMIVYGGQPDCAGGTAYSDVWVLTAANGLGSTPTWIQLHPEGGPPDGRSVHSAVYDAIHNRMIVFGGLKDTITPTNSVWVLSNANGLTGTPVWTNTIPDGTPGSPSARGYHSAVYDAANNSMLVYGSREAPTEMWRLSNANGLGGPSTWTQVNAAGGHPGVSDQAAVFDAANNTMTIFGGNYPGIGLSNQTWVLANAIPSVGGGVFGPDVCGGVPLPDARVDLYSGSDLVASTIADASGLFTFDPAPAPGTYVLMYTRETTTCGGSITVTPGAPTVPPPMPHVTDLHNHSWTTAHQLDLHPQTPSSPTLTAGIDEHLTKQDESAWFKFRVQPGSQVVVTLTNTPANYQLALYKDIDKTYKALTTPSSDADVNRLNAEFAPDPSHPDSFSPDSFSPDSFSPDSFSPDSFSPDSFSPDSFSPDSFSPDSFSPDSFSPDCFPRDVSAREFQSRRVAAAEELRDSIAAGFRWRAVAQLAGRLGVRRHRRSGNPQADVEQQRRLLCPRPRRARRVQSRPGVSHRCQAADGQVRRRADRHSWQRHVISEPRLQDDRAGGLLTPGGHKRGASSAQKSSEHVRRTGVRRRL